MSNTVPRNPVAMPQMLTDALLRNVAGSSALLRVTGSNNASAITELGLAATTFYEVVISPAAMRKLRPSYSQGEQPQWELLLSATGVEQQVCTLQLDSAQALFSMTLAVTVAGQEYEIESVSSNEAFGKVYLYRLQLRESRTKAV